MTLVERQVLGELVNGVNGGEKSFHVELRIKVVNSVPVKFKNSG